jgi:hypothetical protein
VQLFSYAEDDLTDAAPVEHLAEVLDRLEEDVLKATTATPRVLRRAFVRLGEPVDVRDFRGGRNACQALTETLAQRVGELLAELLRRTEPRPKEARVRVAGHSRLRAAMVSSRDAFHAG